MLLMSMRPLESRSSLQKAATMFASLPCVCVLNSLNLQSQSRPFAGRRREKFYVRTARAQLHTANTHDRLITPMARSIALTARHEPAASGMPR